MEIIKYSKPAKTWRQALPLGNGKTGMMIYGSTSFEKICFNDCTLWSGYPKDYNSSESLEYLEKVRKLIFDGKNDEADTLCEDKLIGFYSETFLPLGEVDLAIKGLDKSKYSRSLYLSKAVHTVETMGTKSEAFSSYPDKVSVYKLTSSKPFTVVLSAKSKLKSSVCIKGKNLFLLGNAPDYCAPNYLRDELHPINYKDKKGMAFCLQTSFQTNGKVKELNSKIKIVNATKLILYFVTETGFNSFDTFPETDTNIVMQKCQNQMNGVNKDYDYLKSRHIEDFVSLYNKQSVSFHCDREVDADSLLKSVKAGCDEKALSELMYNYGKYMIISGSRKGGQPLNLQGIWNNSIRPPWSSNYTVNINTQMNYWSASRCGLSDCIEPLIKMVYEVMQNGKKTAQINYGCRGFACNHNVDLWRKTPPVKGDANYMFSPLCGAWLTNEIYAHFKNGELDEYKDVIKEIVSQSALFLNDFLVLHDDKYVICPSVSPENVFTHNGKNCKLDYASSYDMAIVKQAFENALEICDDSDLLSDIKEKLPLLYPFKDGKNGICEWHKNYDTPENGHRHFSPLYAFYPADIIGYYSDEEKREWVRSLYHFRTENSTQYIGWSAAWAICISARLREKENVSKVIKSMLSHSVFKNLFCVHPPFYFQIDGNLGFVAGINEMLITEENGVIEMLPALPDNYSTGEVENMVINGAKVSFKWNNGLVYEANSDKPITVYNAHMSSDIKCNNINFVEVG